MFRLAAFTAADWPAVAAIYEEGMATRMATFETEVPSWEAWDRDHLAEPRIGAWADGELAGWAALSPTSERCVYGGVAEVSIYIGEKHRGQGLGHQLLAALVEASEEAGLWTLTAGIFPENAASIRLHEAHGFKILGVREKLGQMEGVWRDVVQMERRSPTVGLESG